MKIAIMAAGGVGGYLAAKLIGGGHEVAVIARGVHLDAIRRKGLTLRNPEGEVTLTPALATDDPSDIGPVDYVIFAVKAPDATAAAADCKPLLRPGTGVVPFLNGVEASEIVAAELGADAAMMGACYIFARIAEPGVILQTGANARFLFGEPSGEQSERSAALRQALSQSGVDVPLPADIRVEVWRKFVFLASMAGLTAASRASIGEIRENPAMKAVFVRAMEEALSVAKAKGLSMPPDVIDGHLAFFDNAPYEARSSMAQDLTDRRRLENEWLSGAVVRIGSDVGVDTPIHQAIHAILAPFSEGGRDPD